eukprot:m.273936 g.273936  ORF g.273936 m.273936 type:complete len:159 (-) comp19756_c0_seq23:1014-1490(-)
MSGCTWHAQSHYVAHTRYGHGTGIVSWSPTPGCIQVTAVPNATAPVRVLVCGNAPKSSPRRRSGHTPTDALPARPRSGSVPIEPVGPGDGYGVMKHTERAENFAGFDGADTDVNTEPPTAGAASAGTHGTGMPLVSALMRVASWNQPLHHSITPLCHD